MKDLTPIERQHLAQIKAALADTNPVYVASPRTAIPTMVRCSECSRLFDLTDQDDADEWAYGHDCEEE